MCRSQLELEAMALTPWYQERAMIPRTSRMDALIIAASAVLAIGGMLSLRSGEAFGWLLLLLCSVAAAFVVLRPFLPVTSTDGDALDVTPWGISRHNHTGTHEAVSWHDLTEVAVVTTVDALDDNEDVHLILRGKEGSGVVIPHTLAVESGVITELQLRLSEFDNQAFLDAMMSAVNNVFVLWRSPAAVLAPLRNVAAKHSALTLKTAG